MKQESNFKLMLRMSSLVKPLTGYMILAITLGVTGFLCAIFIPYFASLLIAHIAIQAPDFPISVFFIIMGVCAILRGILHYGEQACNHYIAFKLLAILRLSLIHILINDPLAVAYFLNPAICSGFSSNVQVACDGLSRGQTIVDAYDFYQRKANAHILTQVDVHAFFRLFISRILSLIHI